ncbi:MAG: hypothetical protein HC840_32725 [Leptolyngbyaceae cyanobacterium RM2_2_4]|nr:hypothetical protein [Leptolyngbyaceae cyanobacterium RM2_2_4]
MQTPGRRSPSFYDRQSASNSLTHPDTLENWLKDCAKQVRAYLCPPITSLNVKKFEDGSGELQDDLPDRSDTPMATLIDWEEIQERQTQTLQVSQILHHALEQLDPQQKNAAGAVLRSATDAAANRPAA